MAGPDDIKREFTPSPVGVVLMFVVAYLMAGRCLDAGMWLMGKNWFGLLAGLVLIGLLVGAIWQALFWAHLLYLKAKGNGN